MGTIFGFIANIAKDRSIPVITRIHSPSSVSGSKTISAFACVTSQAPWFSSLSSYPAPHPA